VGEPKQTGAAVARRPRLCRYFDAVFEQPVEPLHCVRLELADALTRDAELAADVLEARHRLGLAEAEAELEGPLLPLVELSERDAQPVPLEPRQIAESALPAGEKDVRRRRGS
jgi:hypothetical protein